MTAPEKLHRAPGRRSGAVQHCLASCSRLACSPAAARSWGDKDVVEDPNEPPDVIYKKAETLADKGKFGDAAKQYEEVDINHPYSQEARRAILMAAYAYYKAGKYDDAIGAADRYLTLHPGTQESDLAQDIIAMSYYDRVLDPKRDQTNARKALAAYDTLIAALSRVALRRRGAQPARASCAISWRRRR